MFGRGASYRIETTWVELSREEFSVYISTEKQNVEIFKKLASPFFSVSTSDIPTKDTWQIYIQSFDKVSIAHFPVTKIDMELEPFRTYAFDEKRKIIYLIEPLDTRLRVLIALRFARDILKHLYLSQNMTFLHAGAVIYRGRGICIAGDKKSGKTSTMLAFLAKGADFVSNDDVSVMITQNGDRIAYGWPRTISIREDTKKWMEKIFTPLKDHVSEHPNYTEGKTKGKIFIYPYELSKLFQCSINSVCKIDYVICPQFVDSGAFSSNLVPPNKREQVQTEILDKNLDRYFLEFKKYFPKGNKITSDLFQSIPIYHVSQKINHMDEVVKWMDQVIADS